MAIKKYTCVNCGHTEPFFDHEDRVCAKCQSKDMKRAYGAPLENKITDSADSYRKIDVQKGIEKDLKDRSKRHVADTLDEMIAEFGEQIAKEQGWLLWDETQKKWRKRNDWDTGLLNKANSGSAEVLRKLSNKK